MTLASLLSEINTNILNDLISSEPIYESKILKAVFGDLNIIGMPAVELYRYHFALFHKLYTMQNEYAKEGKYLHVHFMRTALYDYPKGGECAYFHDDKMSFCCQQIADGSTHCEVHSEQLGESAVESLSLKYFYLDTENYDKLDSVTAESLLSGAWEILSSDNSLSDAYVTLGLHGHENSQTVKLRFRELIKEHHPDQGGDRDRFMDINRAYRFIIKWLEDSTTLK